MVRLEAPSGAVTEAREDAVKALLDMGFKRLDEPKKKPARKRAAKTKGE